MSILSGRARWAVPAVVTATVAAVIGTAVLSAEAAPPLPVRSAGELLVGLQQAAGTPLSGTVVETAALGLPALPNVGGHGTTDLTSLVSGSHTLRVWVDGPERARLALLGTLGESDVIHNGRDLWMWNSDKNVASHYALPAGRQDAGSGPPTAVLPSSLPSALPTALPSTPQQAADAVLKLIGPSTTVTTSGTATIAGRPAYELVLAPKDHRSLVGEVRLAVDAEKSVPLRVQVIPRGSTAPAFEVGFTQISFARPSAAQFRFTPPPGATVTQEQLGGTAGTPGATRHAAPDSSAATDPTARTVGSGWTAVVIGTLPTGTESGNGGDTLTALLRDLPTVPGHPGTRMLAGTLFTAVIDGDTIAVGAVPADLALAAMSRR
ncbi:MAG: hypothetical protein HYR62_01255 [Actinobacteria bacterium]|nr:hypothetical protein [Actinomycetota bacterium]MBI3688803.1 hypothetical protein [Actinomycetota bacterium]